MNRFLHGFFNFLLACAAALAGNWLGGQLRQLLTGEPVQTLQFRTTTAKGRQVSSSPVATKFYPAVLATALGRPRPLFALLGGLLAGLLIPDAWEQAWIDRVIEPLIVDRVTALQNCPAPDLKTPEV